MEQTYTVPVTLTVTGWVEIRASDRMTALAQAAQLNKEGVALDQIEDQEFDSEVHVAELAPSR